jgi:hypothetical protein
MFKNVSSHLKGMATGFLGNVTSKIGGLTGQISGVNSLMPSISGAQGKVAAQLLKKSPLEIPETPLGVAKSNPLQFSFTQYPLDLQNNGTGHYVIFYALSNKYGNVDEALNVAGSITPSQVSEQTVSGEDTFKKLKNLRGLKTSTGVGLKPVRQENSVLSKKPTHTQTTAAIALYMPPGVTVNYSMEYAGSPTDAAGTIAQALGSAASADSKKAQIESILSGVKGAAGGSLMKALDEVGSSLGAGEPAKLITKAFGIALNPHEEQFFEKPNFRTFTYSFEFWPRSEKEAQVVDGIVKLFKYHMHPTLDTAAGGRFFKVPSEFEIHYAYLGQENEYLNKISRCVLSNMDIKYGPDEQFSAFRPDQQGKGNPPVTTSMSLTFKETQFITKQDILAGY